MTNRVYFKVIKPTPVMLGCSLTVGKIFYIKDSYNLTYCSLDGIESAYSTNSLHNELIIRGYLEVLDSKAVKLLYGDK